jgi:uncharacterized protein
MPNRVNAMLSGRFFAPLICFPARRLWLALLVVAVTGAGGVDRAAAADTLQRGAAAMAREDYAAAARILSPIAQAGNPDAQAYMGDLYAMGRGVPQDYTQAALWYRRAAEQGQPAAQYELGLLYDKGHGVPENVVEAEKWLILATAGAPRGLAEARAQIRDAVRTKMTRGELAQARMRAHVWRGQSEQ